MKTNPIIIFVLILQLVTLTPFKANAIDVGSFASGFDFKTGPSEYVIQEHPNQQLIAVHLLSGVAKPGLYRIPKKTNLITLLSYSGGLTKNANTEEITIKNFGKKSTSNVKLEDLMSSKGSGPTMKDRDILLIQEKEPLFDSDTIAIVSMTASVLGIIAVSLALSDRNND